MSTPGGNPAGVFNNCSLLRPGGQLLYVLVFMQALMCDTGPEQCERREVAAGVATRGRSRIAIGKSGIGRVASGLRNRERTRHGSSGLMATSRTGSTLRQLRTLFSLGHVGDR